MSCDNPRSRSRRGFTLVEIMIVIVIIGLLAGAVAIHANSYLGAARQSTARKEIATIKQALETFNATYGRYPTNEEGLVILTQPTPKIPERLLDGQAVDPWGHPYQYNCPGKNNPYEVISFGPNGREGDGNISSDDLKQ